MMEQILALEIALGCVTLLFVAELIAISILSSKIQKLKYALQKGDEQ